MPMPKMVYLAKFSAASFEIVNRGFLRNDKW